MRINRTRVFFLTFLIGIVSTPYLTQIFESWSEIDVDVPTASAELLYVRPELEADIPRGGGGSGGREIRRSVMKDVYLNDARIRDADFTHTEIVNSDFSGAILRGADFSEASVMYSSFIKADLAGADFSNGKLYGSDLTNSTLANVSFKKTNLSHSDFSNAVVEGADFRDANLSNANLESARGLTYDQIRSALINYDTKLPSHLISKRSALIEQSRLRTIELANEMTSEETERYFNSFDFFELTGQATARQ